MLYFRINTDLPAGICFGWENFGRHEAEAMGRHEAEAMGRHEAEAMGRQTDLVLDASLPKHKNDNIPIALPIFSQEMGLLDKIFAKHQPFILNFE